MPNAFKRPADADKLDSLEQLKKLREALLRDASARESDDENAPDDSADEAVNRKKEAAARRFAGVSGNAESDRKPIGSASTPGRAKPQSAPKKNVAKGTANLSAGSSGSPASASAPAPQRKEIRGGLAVLAELASLSGTSGKAVAPDEAVVTARDGRALPTKAL